MKRGILIFACGHPFYGRLAFNLAMTIRATGSQMPIAVVHTASSLTHLSELQKNIFTERIYADNLPAGCGCKVMAYDYTPFEETLLLDADMAWLPYKKPEDLFDELHGLDFTGITEGFYDYETNENNQLNQSYFYWADTAEIKAKYKIKSSQIYQWRSEVLFFSKTAKTAKLFKDAKRIFAKPGLSTMKKYGDGTPDELAFNIAAAINDVHPHQYGWCPSYWYIIRGGAIPDLSSLYNGYYLASFGSNYSSGEAKSLYNRVVKGSAYKTGFQHVFPLVSKREWLPERKNT